MNPVYNLSEAVSTLRQGGLILYPTDTIWGIGCDATDDEAVRKIFALKRREVGKSFVLLVDDIEMIRSYVHDIHPRLETLLSFHQRPLTVVYDRARNLAPSAVANDGSVAMRIPHDELCRQLVREFGRPIVATSANVSHEPFPEHFGVVSSEIIEGVDHVVRYRQFDKTPRQPSPIVKLSDPIHAELIFLRE